MVGLAAGLAGLAVGLAAGLTFGLMGMLTVRVGPAVQLAVVEAIWRLRGKRVRFMTLLQTALDRQVLRQAGTVYQFRHAALQDLLADHDFTTPAAEPRPTSTPTMR